MGSKWYRFINGVFGVIYSFALGTLLFEVSFTEDDVAMFVVSDFSVRGLLRCGYGVFLSDVYR